MILDIYFFIIFVLGILQIYVLANSGEYFRQIKTNVIKKIINPKLDFKDLNVDIAIQYFNLITHFFILVGLITNYWYYFLIMYIFVYSSSYLQDKYSSKNGSMTKTFKSSKVMTYTTIFLKIVGLFGLSLMYFHGLL